MHDRLKAGTFGLNLAPKRKPAFSPRFRLNPAWRSRQQGTPTFRTLPEPISVPGKRWIRSAGPNTINNRVVRSAGCERVQSGKRRRIMPTFVLIDASSDLWVESLEVDAPALGLGESHPWSVKKHRLRGGRREGSRPDRRRQWRASLSGLADPWHGSLERMV